MTPFASDLDPKVWSGFRRLAHQALDAMINDIETLRDRPVWVETPPQPQQELPLEGRGLAATLAEFDANIKPYVTGNRHPAFMGWAHGAGTPVGMVAEMLAAGLNANCGGRNHVGIEVEKQLVSWMAQAFGFPTAASGLFVTGASQANFVAVLIARRAALGAKVRADGVNGRSQLCAYASQEAHGCIAQAMDMAGLGAGFLRRIACDGEGRMSLPALAAQVAADRAAGLRPFLLVGSAGTVNFGAVDPLAELAAFATTQNLWMHVDGAFGALAIFSEKLRPKLAGIEQADSIAFDFHKWAHVPYDAGFILVREQRRQTDAFASPQAYLSRAASGLAAGEIWPCDLGPDLSRGFRALKVWFTLQSFGTRALGEAMERNCAAARLLADLIQNSDDFVLAAPTPLNIVCFSLKGDNADSANRRLVEALHRDGIAAPSITLIGGQATIRCAIFNHRTNLNDIAVFFAGASALARAMSLTP
jgi:glutamate/tyrosine decarboxylase-like PLP-dependent enzyme